MSDPNQRLIAWQIKTDTGKVKEILDIMRPDMLKHYETAVVASARWRRRHGRR